jgi:hypothetical protein
MRDAEAEVVSPPPPLFRQASDCVTHFERHKHGLKRRVLDRHWIIEDDHYAIASRREPQSDDANGTARHILSAAAYCGDAILGVDHRKCVGRRR